MRLGRVLLATFGKIQKLLFLKASAATIQIEVQLPVGPFQLTTGWNWFSLNARITYDFITASGWCESETWPWVRTKINLQTTIVYRCIWMCLGCLRGNPGALLKPTTLVEGHCIWLHFAGSNQPRPSKGYQLLRRRKDEPVFMQHIDTILQPQNHWTHPMINWPAGKNMPKSKEFVSFTSSFMGGSWSDARIPPASNVSGFVQACDPSWSTPAIS